MLHFSNSPRLVDFAIRLVVSVLNLADGQVKFFWNSKLQKNCNQSCLSNMFFRLHVVEMIFGLHASYSLPKCQATKLTFFVPWWVKFRTLVSLHSRCLLGGAQTPEFAWVVVHKPREARVGRQTYYYYLTSGCRIGDGR